MSRSILTTVALVLLVLLMQAAASADTIRLVGGDILQGTIVSESDTSVTLDHAALGRIEIARDRAFAKYHAREARWNPFTAFVATFFEAILAVLGLRMLYRAAKALYAKVAARFGRGARPVAPVAGD